MKNWFESKYSIAQMKEIYQEYYKAVYGKDAPEVPGHRCTYASLLEELDRASRIKEAA